MLRSCGAATVRSVTAAAAAAAAAAVAAAHVALRTRVLYCSLWGLLCDHSLPRRL